MNKSTVCEICSKISRHRYEQKEFGRDALYRLKSIILNTILNDGTMTSQ